MLTGKLKTSSDTFQNSFQGQDNDEENHNLGGC